MRRDIPTGESTTPAPGAATAPEIDALDTHVHADADDVLTPGIATGIGSLPHTDPRAAARTVMRLLPDLPATPQLPMRSPREALLAQWLGALDEVTIDGDGALGLSTSALSATPLDVSLDADAHAGVLAWLDELDRSASTRRVKVQVTGPLTLGLALARAGVPTETAFARGADLAVAWSVELVRRVRARAPGAAVVVFCDEPALVAWRRDDAPIHRDEAVDRLSATLARIPGVCGVHVCSAGDVRIACEAGPAIVGLDTGDDLADQALAIGRHLDGGGWIAWGAVPTHRPIGDSPEPLWRRLVEAWCELTRRGCDPLAIRSRAMLTPACGLAGHGLTQAERALRLATEIGRRVGDQAAATRLTIGA
jgi:hypothetical protein